MATLRTLMPRTLAALATLAAVVVGPADGGQEPAQVPETTPTATAPGDREPAPRKKVHKTEVQWQRELNASQYWVLRRKGTEPAFSGRFARGKFQGVFVCAGCEAPLFSSRHKFDSGTGWPSFFRPVDAEALATAPDYHLAEPRVEVMCWQCEGHLGHVFNDGPRPTGLRYCVNSAALKLVPFERPAGSKDPGQEAGPAPGEEAGVADSGSGEGAGQSSVASAESAPPASAPRTSRFRRRAPER